MLLKKAIAYTEKDRGEFRQKNILEEIQKVFFNIV